MTPEQRRLARSTITDSPDSPAEYLVRIGDHNRGPTECWEAMVKAGLATATGYSDFVHYRLTIAGIGVALTPDTPY